MTDSAVNLEDYRVDSTTLPRKATPRVATLVKGARYLGRNVPMDWLECAAGLPGAAFKVAVALAHQAAIEKANTVKPPTALLRRFGVRRGPEDRALRRLEALGLIAVERHQGRRPRVTLRWDGD